MPAPPPTWLQCLPVFHKGLNPSFQHTPRLAFYITKDDFKPLFFCVYMHMWCLCLYRACSNMFMWAYEHVWVCICICTSRPKVDSGCFSQSLHLDLETMWYNGNTIPHVAIIDLIVLMLPEILWEISFVVFLIGFCLCDGQYWLSTWQDLCPSLLFCCWDKHHDQKHVGEERAYLAYTL